MKDYHDFRPILAEVEERPANPAGRIFLWTIILLMVVIISGLIFVKVDVVVSARGKIIPVGDVKVLQPLETGVVNRILVKEGDFVKKGDVLVEIDPSMDRADLEGKERNLRFNRIAMERIKAVLDGKEFMMSGNNPEADTQLQLYHSQKSLYILTIQEKEKEFRETEIALKSLKDEIWKLKNLLNIVADEEKRQKSLSEIGALAENRYMEKLKERMNLEKEIDIKTSQVEEYTTRLEKIREEIETFKSGFKEKLLSELSGNVQGKNVLEAEVSNIKFRQGKRFITSPVNGYVHLLPVKTVGGVVTPAQPLVSIVPEKTPLMTRSLVFNKDIGFVKEGQRCVIKVDTYDFQKYGVLEGEVETVSPFSIEDKENGIDGYPVHVKMSSEELKTKDGKVYKIKPGMSVTAEINVGKRRVIEFFLFPVIKYLDEGLKVR